MGGIARWSQRPQRVARRCGGGGARRQRGDSRHLPSRIDVKPLVATVMALNLLPAHSTVAAQLRTDNPAGDVWVALSGGDRGERRGSECDAVWERTAGGWFGLTRNWV